MNKTQPEKENYRIRDIHTDQDSKLIERIKSQLEWLEEKKKTICIVYMALFGKQTHDIRDVRKKKVTI